MSRNQRNQPITISFDGLTDAVTNLAGTLILLVVLILGVTHAARPGRSSREQSSDATSATVLLQRIHALEMEISLIDRQILQAEQEVPELRQRVQKLLQRSGPSPDKDNARQAPGYVQESTNPSSTRLATVALPKFREVKP